MEKQSSSKVTNDANNAKEATSVGGSEYLTDQRVAEYLLKRDGGRFRFTPQRGWVAFDDDHWTADHAQSAVHHRLNSLIKVFLQNAINKEDSPSRTQMLKEIIKLDAASRREAIVRAASRLKGFQADLRDFDADPWVVPHAGGDDQPQDR
jgi:hypothetical protein